MIFNMVGKGGGGSLLISDTLDANGGIIRTITATKAVKLQTKTITPTSSVQVIDPDTGYDGFSQVTVEAGSGGIDGNNLEYGLTDGTQPIVGAAKVGSAVI